MKLFVTFRQAFVITFQSDKTSNIFKHLGESRACSDACSSEYFSIIDCVNTKFSLKIKEALHINWCKPFLTVNCQINWYCLTKMTRLLSLKTDMFQQLQLPSSELHKTKWKQMWKQIL